MTAKQSNSLQKTCLATANLSNSQELCEFFDLFFVCETTAKQLIQYSKVSQERSRRTPKKASYPSEYKTTQIDSAVRYFRLPIASAIIEQIFKGGTGSLSCRQLRNGYVHKVPTGKDEIENRFEELKGYMEQWIDMFSNQDNHINH